MNIDQAYCTNDCVRLYRHSIKHRLACYDVCDGKHVEEGNAHMNHVREFVATTLLVFAVLILFWVLGGGLAAPDPDRAVTWEDRQEYEDPAWGAYGSGT